MKLYSESDYVKVTDAAGRPLPPVPKAWNTTNGLLADGVKKHGSASATPRTSSTGPAVDQTGAAKYEAMTKADLEAEVASRRGAGAEVEVAEPGNKPDLIAALVKHDGVSAPSS